MGRLKRQYMRTSRMVIARTSAYTGIDGPAMRGGCDGEGVEAYKPLKTAAAGCALLKFFAVYEGITSGMSLLKMTIRSGNVSGDVCPTCAEFVYNVHTDVGAGVGGVVGQALYAWTYLDNHSVVTGGAWAFATHVHLWTHGEAVLAAGNVASLYIQCNIAAVIGAGSLPAESYGIVVAANGAERPTACLDFQGGWTTWAVFLKNEPPWQDAGDVTGKTKAGFLKVTVAGGDRFIQLYGP